MNRFMIVFIIWGITFSYTTAEDTREAVRAEVMKYIVNVDNARQDAIKELRETVKAIESARVMREGKDRQVEVTQIKEIKEEAISKIEKSVLLVEVIKEDAKKSITKAVIKVKKLKEDNASVAEVKVAKLEAIKTISKAISSVEVAKANAATVMIKQTAKVEIAKVSDVKKFSVKNCKRHFTKVKMDDFLKMCKCKCKCNKKKIKKDKKIHTYSTKFIRFKDK